MHILKEIFKNFLFKLNITYFSYKIILSIIKEKNLY